MNLTQSTKQGLTYSLGSVTIMILVMALIALGADKCNKAKVDREIKASLDHYIKDSVAFSTQRQKDSSTIMTQQQMMLDIKTAQALKLIDLVKENTRLKNITSQLQTSTLLSERNQTIEFDTLTKIITVYVDSGKKVQCLTLPWEFNNLDAWVPLWGFEDSTGLHWNTDIRNKQTITWGTPKLKLNNLFKKTEPVIEVINTNPYLVTSGIRNVEIISKPHWYDNRWFWFGTGFVLGSGVGIGTGYAVGHK